MVADAPWSDEEMLRHVRGWVLQAMKKRSRVCAGSWMTKDFRKKGNILWE